MASADEISPQNGNCEICGAVLGDRVVVQEFADGSLARLCPECAAGAELVDTPADTDTPADAPFDAPTPAAADELEPEAGIWHELPEENRAEVTMESDPLEKTRELLMPVNDLIALQGEMQTALERLAAALERFALEMITESQERSAVQSRVQELERELDKTRTQLAEAEFLLNAAAQPPQPAQAEAMPMPTFELPELANPSEYSVVPKSEAAAEKPASTFASPTDDTVVAEPVSEPAVMEPPATEPAPQASRPLVAPPTGPGKASAEVDQPSGSTFVPAMELANAAGEVAAEDLPTFRIDEVQAAQRYYNESLFVSRISDVRKSLGRPKANLTRVPGEASLAFVTFTWDIVWYQYLVDLRRDIPVSAERVCLYREGMDLDELAYYFREKNAVVNDDGKLDASELEVRLLGDPSALITEMVPEETVLMDDLTEEHWGSGVAPEFKWDD